MKIKTSGTYSNLKPFAQQMKLFIKQKYNPQNGRKYLKTKQLTKYLTSKICEQLMELNIKNKQPNHKMGRQS